LIAGWALAGCGRVGFTLGPASDAGVAQPDAGLLPCAGELGGDDDQDDVCGVVDNCAAVANRSQLDTDGDEEGDACDVDDDGDETGDADDTCPLDLAGDSDEDGSCDHDDTCPGSDDTSDADGDGVPDGCDLASCGDGMLEPELGETCEPSSMLDPCPSSCDDGMRCTADLMSGDPNSCNVRCDNPAITEPDNEDGCCPPSTNALSDLDCPPICGNGVPETGEACDGGPLCNADCTKTDEARCLDADTTSAPPACKQCRCSQCTQPSVGCLADPDPSFATHCRDMIDCAQVNDCLDESCFCGSSSNCWVSSNGPCKTEITEAAEAQNQTAYDCSRDPTCSVYQSQLVGDCVGTNCRAECSPP
jgi:hypothetical protein